MTTPRRGRPAVKSQHIEKTLRQRLMAGEWSSGTTLPNEVDLAAELGVSRMCLRRALTALTGDGLLTRTRGRGTVVTGAEAPRCAGLRRLALLLRPAPAEEERAYHDLLLRGIREALEGQDCSIAFHTCPESEPPPLSPQWDAFLIHTGLFDRPQLERLRNEGRPVVGLSRPEGDLPMSWVDIDNEAGGALAMQHLLQCGWRRPMIIDEAQRSPFAAARERGIRRVLAEAGVPLPEAHVVRSSHIRDAGAAEAVEAIVAPFLAAGAIDSVFVYMERPTIGVYRAIAARGLRVGADLAVIHCNDYPWLREVLQPQPTAIRLPFERVAAEAARILLAQARERRPRNESRTVAPELMVRGSCPPRGA